MEIKKILAIILLITFWGACSKEKNKYCRNELKLISNFKKAIQTNIQTEKIRKDVNQSVISFLENSRCQAKLNYKLPLENGEQIDLAFNINYHCEPVEFTPRYFCHIFVGDSDTLLIEQELETINNVSNRVYEFYKTDGSLKDNLKNYKHVYISFLWGQKTNAKVLNKVIEKAIDGYIQFANSLSNEKFQKSIDELNQNELKNLSKIIPFQFRTDFMNGYEGYDFIGRKLKH